jgi:SNF2 family DNA or RNA helicase
MLIPDWTALNWSVWLDKSNHAELEALGILKQLGWPAKRQTNLNLLLKASKEDTLSLNEEERLSRIIKKLTDVWSGMTANERERLNFFLDVNKQPKLESKKVEVVLPFSFPASMAKATNQHIVLHAYQRRAIKFAIEHKRSILAMEMGLGKTLIAITVAHLLNKINEVTRILIVAPKSAHDSWHSHLRDFTDTPHALVSGWTPAKREAVYLDFYSGLMPIVIVTPQTFANDKLYFNRILERHGSESMLILDEAHKAKASESLIGLTFENLAKLASRVLALTGTPQPNTIEDLYYLVERVKPGTFGDKSSFSTEYTYRELDLWDSIKGNSYRPGALKAKKLKQLHENLKKVMLVISLKDPDVCLHLPKRKDLCPYLPMDPLQKKILSALKYTTAEKEINAPSFEEALNGKRGLLDQIGAEGATANLQVLGTRIEQLAISPALFSDTFIKEYPDYESSKVAFIADAFMAFLNGGGEAGVIFCEHLKGLEIMSNALLKRGLLEKDIAFYNGQTTQKQREQITVSLNEGKIKVVLGQTKALETGANLQKKASFVAHLSTTWSPDTLVQSTARVYRQGQTKEVLVLRPSGSRLEEAKNMALTRKIIQSQSATGLQSLAEEDVLKTSSDPRIRKAHQELSLQMRYNKYSIDSLIDLEVL